MKCLSIYSTKIILHLLSETFFHFSRLLNNKFTNCSLFAWLDFIDLIKKMVDITLLGTQVAAKAVFINLFKVHFYTPPLKKVRGIMLYPKKKIAFECPSVRLSVCPSVRQRFCFRAVS